MPNEMARARLADLVESVKSGMESIARAQQEQAQLTATATGAGRRITATVNAHGVLVDLKFADSIDELSPAELAKEIVATTQAAAIEVQRKTQEVLAALQSDTARIPRLSEFVPGIPDVHDMLPTPPPVSMAAPGARIDEDDEDLPRPMVFTDVETEDPDAPPNLADRGHW